MIAIEQNQATGLRRVAVALSAAAITSFVAAYHVGVAPAVLFDNVEKFGRKKARPRSNIPLPIGKILCFGRGSFEGLVAMLNNAFASLQDKKPKVLGEGTYLRPGRV